MMRTSVIRILCFLCLGALLLSPHATSAQWRSMGPFGGDVRTLTQDPNHPQTFFLGTADSQIFVSTDAGASWQRQGAVSPRSDMVVDHILVNPSDSNRLFAGLWSISSNSDGGVFASGDAGKTWKELAPMHGQSVRALAMAPSNPLVLVVGSLEGVFRSLDGGNTWSLISPPRHAEIRNVESIAIDPGKPDTIYAGTWHLPWKTVDGGKSWVHIQRGIIEDSDVFAIFIHPTSTDSALLSACSGIYQTTDGGNLWSKFKGIPPSSRRTRAITADPSNPKLIYAGTTEGLWKTSDGGGSWNLMTSKTLTVNAIVIDSKDPSKVLLGTDNAGVLISTDGALHFRANNEGFTSRIISSVLIDRRNPKRILVSVLFDHEDGGVFQSDDGARSWKQIVEGLTSTDVHTLFQSPDDFSIWCGTSDGAYILDKAAQRWRRVDLGTEPQRPGREQRTMVPKTNGRKGAPMDNPLADTIRGMGSVLSFSGSAGNGHGFLAASQRGLFLSRDSGKKWTRLPIPEGYTFGTAVLSHADGRIFYGTSRGLLFSKDDGLHWSVVELEGGGFPIRTIVALPGNEKVLLMATGRGLYRSTDGGATWNQSWGGLPRSDISDIQTDTRTGTQIFVTESLSGAAYRSTDLGETWDWINPLLVAGLKCKSILADPSNSNRFYALFFREGLYRQEEPSAPRPATVRSAEIP
jgi:photosystem II stability/assembly factor-like uncharacterized protein